MAIIFTGLQNRVKNSAAYSEDLGLMLIANGEELPYLLTASGYKMPAGITPPIDTPVVTDDAAGTLEEDKYVVYQVVYVSENGFPLVSPKIFSNPSAQIAYHIPSGTGDRKNQITAGGSTNPLVTHVYLYRTTLQDTEDLAQVAADAGLLFLVDSVDNDPGGVTFSDNTLTNIGNDQISLINFIAPQFRFVVYDGSYFWGFANHAFSAQATWETDGTITLADPSRDKFWGGRDGQYITLNGINTGGIDGRGTFLFLQTGDYTGKLTLADGSDAFVDSTLTDTITITGESATLYRSGYRNPFQWGYMQNIAGSYIPALWALKVAGNLGTAIAVAPDQSLLKLDMEFPALCVSYSLQASGLDVASFSQTKRQVSRLYSVTSHFSQFVAISEGRQVLWGMDFKSKAIVQSDGYNQVPISGPISILLRQLSKNRAYHLLSHGVYDARTEINAMWLSTAAVDDLDAEMMFDVCVYQHAPTGFWGVLADYGILSSAFVEDSTTSERSILVGTEHGFLGKAFDNTTYGNWLPDTSLLNGFVNAATPNSITRSEGQDDFDPTAGTLVNNFVILHDADGLNVQIRKITSVTSDTLYFDRALDVVPNTTDDPGLTDEPQWKFFIGLIELRVLKYMDDGTPSVDKTPRETWATLADAGDVRVDFLPEHTDEVTLSVPMQQDNDTQTFKQKLQFPTKKGKSFGLAIVERSYNPTRFFNFTVK